MELLALEWDSREIRVAVAEGRGQRVTVEHAFAIPWDDRETESEPIEPRMGRRIADELDRRGIGRPPALVAVGRASIELRQIQLPPAPDAELPDLVQFQAAREFNELDEHWLLDFVPIDQGPEGPRTVLATAIAPAVIGQIEAVCHGAGLKMQRLLLRPCEAASRLAGGATTPRGQLRLLVDLLADEADLTVVLDGKAVFLRTMRLGGEAPSLPALLAEIRLTMAAAQNQLAGQRVQGITLYGGDRTLAELARSIEDEVGVSATVVDPFAGLDLGASLRGSLPEHPGRFASLLGMLLAESRQSGHAIDFLHPRRRPEVRGRRRLWIAAGAAAVLLLLGYLLYARVQNMVLVGEVERLKAEIKQLDASLVPAKKLRATVAEIAKWTDGDTIWLDQLLAINEGFPPAKDAVLNQLTMSAHQGASQVELKGGVRNAEILAEMEKRVRERAGQITTKTSREDRSNKDYPLHFEATIRQGKGGKP